jgi:hypothetical protein
MISDPLHHHYYDQFIAELSLSHRQEAVVLVGLCDAARAASVSDALRDLVDQRLAGRIPHLTPDAVAGALATSLSDAGTGQAIATATVRLPIEGVARDDGAFFWANTFLYDFARSTLSAPHGVEPLHWVAFQAALRGIVVEDAPPADIAANKTAVAAFKRVTTGRETVATWANGVVTDRDLAVAQFYDWQAGEGELYAMTRNALQVQAAQSVWKPFSDLFNLAEKEALLLYMRGEMARGLADGLGDASTDFGISREQAQQDMDQSAVLTHPDILLGA